MKCTPEEAFELAVKAGFAPPIRETDRYRFVRLIDLVRAIPKSEMREQFEQWYLQVFKDKDVSGGYPFITEALYMAWEAATMIEREKGKR